MSPISATLVAPTRSLSSDHGSVRNQELSLGEKDTQRSLWCKQQSVHKSIHSDTTTGPIDKKRKQRPGSESAPKGPTALSEQSTIGNKCALWTSAPRERRNGDVVVEGLLMVAEQEVKGEAKTIVPVYKTLGAMYCILSQERSGLVLEIVSINSNPSIKLNVDTMDLVHKPCQEHFKFLLRYRASKCDDTQALSYAFMASTKAKYSEWVNGIDRFQTKDHDTVLERSDNSAAAPDYKKVQSLSWHQQKQQRRQKTFVHGQSSLGAFKFATPPRTKHMILVRHGHYINAHAPDISDSKQVLSQMGRLQAEFTGQCLRMAHTRIPKRVNVTVVHSDMTRAVEAAAIIAGNFSDGLLESSSLLREGWPGTPYSSDTPTDDKQSRMDNARMQKAFDTFFLSPHNAQDENDDESYCILVCHANLIRFFLCRALGIEATNTWGHFEINHCGITRIDVCANCPIKVMAVNETGHLPQTLITSSEDHL